MSLIKDLIPTNLQQEKERFLANPKSNPQFNYHRDFFENELTQYGQPKAENLEVAQQIVDQAYQDKVDSDLYAHRGPLLSQNDLTNKIKTFLEMHHLADRYKLVFSSSFVTRTSITPDTIKLRTPLSFTQEGLMGMLYHEIGTHALRRINYEQQPWFKRKKKFGFSEYLFTEEGLATIHTLLPQVNSLAFSPALKYLTVQIAQTSSFAETWQFLTPYIDNLEKRWQIVYRQKRGLTDTSKPGGFTKDICYFGGLIEVFNWLMDHNLDPTQLYYGKLALEDVPKAVNLYPEYQPILPSFWLLDPQAYAEGVYQIGKANHLVE